MRDDFGDGCADVPFELRDWRFQVGHDFVSP